MLIQVKKGLIYSDRKVLEVSVSDRIALANDFQYAEEFVNANNDKEFNIDDESYKIITEIAPAGDDTANDDEKALIEKFKLGKERVEKLTAELKTATNDLDDINDKLLEILEADEKNASAKYEGLGYVVRIVGAAHASIEKGRQDEVKEYLRSQGREDMIKESVHASTLSSYVRECLKENAALPPGVTFYKPKWVNFYPAK